MKLGHRNAPGLPGSVSIDLPAHGPLLVPGWRAGGAARLELLDAAGHAVGGVDLHVPTTPQRFRVDLTELVPPSGRLEVRALDPFGRRIERLDYALTEPGRTWTQHIRVDGDTFVLEPVALGRYVVTLRAPGHRTQEFADLEVTATATTHALVLEPARRLKVALVDRDGRLLAAQHAEAQGPSGNWEAPDFPDDLVGAAVFPELPLEPLELKVRIGTRTWTRAVDAEQTSLALDLPAHGRLALTVAARERLTTEDGHLEVRVRGVEDEDALRDRVWVNEDGTGPSLASYDLLPGRYAVEVDLREFPPGARESDTPLVTPLSSREVEVRAGETTEVVIGP